MHQLHHVSPHYAPVTVKPQGGDPRAIDFFSTFFDQMPHPREGKTVQIASCGACFRSIYSF